MNEIDKYYERHRIINIKFLIIPLILFLNFLFKNDYLSLICTIFVCCDIFFSKKQELIKKVIFYSFFSYLYTFNGYNIYIFPILCVMIKTIFLNSNRSGLYILITIIYFFIHYLSSFGQEFRLGNLIPFFSVLLLLFLCLNYDKKNKESYARFFIFGFFYSSILGLFKSGTRINELISVDYISINEWQDTIRFSGISFDCNFYGILVVITLLLLIFQYNLFKKKTKLLLIIITSILGFLTYSKSIFLCLIFIFVLAMSKKRFDKNVTYIFALSVILVSAIIFIPSIKNYFITIIGRFLSAENFDELTSNRSSIWIMYLNQIKENPLNFLIGYGVNGELLQIKASHNTYIEILYKFGLLGFITDIGLIMICYKMVNNEERITLPKFFIILIFLMLLFNLSAYTFYSLGICIFIVFQIITSNIHQGGKNEIVNCCSCI